MVVRAEGDPVRHHGSHFISCVADRQRALAPRELALWHRLAAGAHKSAIIAAPGREGDHAPAAVLGALQEDASSDSSSEVVLHMIVVFI